MSVAPTLKAYLAQRHVDYELIHHSHTSTSIASARQAQLTPERLAKAVVLKDSNGFLLAVLPATHVLELEALNRLLGRQLTLSSEAELGQLFPDCEVGAVPPIGSAYGVPVALDESLTVQPEIYCEAGNHTELIHLQEEQFETLLKGATIAPFSIHLA